MEQVYVLPAERFPAPSGRLLELTEAFWLELCGDGRFMPRAAAEQDPRFRQVIPYCVVRFEGRLLLMRRTRGGGEARLHDLHTLGVGGHINPEDQQGGADQGDLISSAMRRELLEEIHLGGYQARPVGLIVMDDSAVSRVHAGVVFLVESEEAPWVRETEKLEGGLASLEEVGRAYGKLESWSQLAFNWLARQPGSP
ncbi:MAG: NUDIX domain-containing protein [Meiothermus sp.]|nr:NUDIX domain-containing protein [Meiothermus sp.]